MAIPRLLVASIAVAIGATLAVLATATPSAAHVTANPRTAEQGGFAKISFRMPNERDNADTTKLELFLPPEHPLAFVSIRKVPGWTTQVEKRKLDQPITSGERTVTEVVSKITWTGGKLPPGEFEEFDVSMGRLPTNTDRLIFRAIQTYSSGEIVRWIEDPAPEGQPSPRTPAPMIKLLKPASPSPTPVAASSHVGASDATARWLAGIGLALGLLGLLAGAYAVTRSRSTSS